MMTHGLLHMNLGESGRRPEMFLSVWPVLYSLRTNFAVSWSSSIWFDALQLKLWYCIACQWYNLFTQDLRRSPPLCPQRPPLPQPPREGNHGAFTVRTCQTGVKKKLMTRLEMIIDISEFQLHLQQLGGGRAGALLTLCSERFLPVAFFRPHQIWLVWNNVGHMALSRL